MLLSIASRASSSSHLSKAAGSTVASGARNLRRLSASAPHHYKPRRRDTQGPGTTTAGRDSSPHRSGTYPARPLPRMQGSGKAQAGKGRSRPVQVSMLLSRLLRHQAPRAGIELDSEGYASLDKVMKWRPIRDAGVTIAEIRDVVAENDKQRFTIKLKLSQSPSSPSLPATPAPAPESCPPDSNTGHVPALDQHPSNYLIRANQGHSIPLQSSEHLVPLTVEAGNIPARVVHGTYHVFWAPILAAGGLRPMGRNHIHCATGTPEDNDNDNNNNNNRVRSGMRRDAQLIITIDVERSIADGVSWWMSSNGVVLTEGDADGLLSTRYFLRVEGRRWRRRGGHHRGLWADGAEGRGGRGEEEGDGEVEVGVLWENGVAVGELPRGVRMDMPRGKNGGRGGGRGDRKGGGKGDVQAAREKVEGGKKVVYEGRGKTEQDKVEREDKGHISKAEECE